MILKSIFKEIGFVSRYKKLCIKHNDFDNRLRANNNKIFLEKLKTIDNSVVYLSKDKMFKIYFPHDNYSLDLGISVKNGLVEVFLFYIKDEEWLLYNRFDGYAEELDETFDREIHNIPKYTSEKELEVILKEVFSIYEDMKKEIVK